jgi:hypothetical protein
MWLMILCAASVGATNRSAPIQRLVVSSFLCDFGNVVLGSSRKRMFRITNTGFSPISFEFDKRLLNSAGFTVEPVCVSVSLSLCLSGC